MKEKRWTIKDTDGKTVCYGDDDNIGVWLVDTLNEIYPGRFTLIPEDATPEDAF